ncbi:tyrosine-protein kinase JAK2-like protein [Leptotrombidium deliense]|uniref:Tyrosine-protein kinase n=1 Tax=Leptotrombidium deliense TaxID=299467 RepID=A0A443SCN9_9ACAR|nr:tyrosine-protein kinase JAK2-like protein [Leptotrombidium deliense]
MANSSNSFRIFLFKNDVKSGREEVLKLFDDNLEFVDDLIISCAKDLKISPVSRHLLGIYERTQNLWLSPNETLCSIRSDLFAFELRIRFKPYNISDLGDADEHAFKYYFNQIRYDFLNEKVDSKQKERLLGLVIADIVRYSLESNIPKDEALDKVNLNYFLPSKCALKKNPLVFFKSKDIKANFDLAWHCSQGSADFIKREYMESIAFRSNPLLEDYGVEKYVAKRLYQEKTEFKSLDVEIQCHSYNDVGLYLSLLNEPKTRKKEFSISDICYVSINSTTNTIEIQPKIGMSFCLWFPDKYHLKSFVSAVDGLYRLTEQCFVNVCSEISSPTLQRLRKMKCHGPVDVEFAYKKLKAKGNNKIGTYLLRESPIKFNEYYLDVIVGFEKFKSHRIEKKSDGYFIDGNSDKFCSLTEIINSLTIDKNNETVKPKCLPPSDYDKPANLLMCRNISDLLKEKKDVESPAKWWPKIIPREELKLNYEQIWKSNSILEVSLAEVGNKRVVAKVIKNETVGHKFLEKLSDWAKVRFDSIIHVVGISVYSPLALIVEYLPNGPYDTFLVTNHEKLKIVDLVESIMYVARAVEYLEQVNVTHGKIRCHNLLVYQYESNKLKVKLSDPLSDDLNRLSEGAWISPESKKTIASDVWAFGTTVWEIFSYGSKPDSEKVSELNKPCECPTEIWKVITDCWILDPDQRKRPRSIVADIHQLLFEVYNSRRSNTYSYPNVNDCNEKKFNGIGSLLHLLKGKASSKNSIDTVSTLPIDSIATYPKDEEASIAADTWLIDRRQLEFGELLGEGFYGEVRKATLSKWANLAKEEVAVKSIKCYTSDTFFDMRREINIMKKLRHTNIVEIKGYVEDEQLMLVMEYFKLGSLVAYLERWSNENIANRKDIPFLKFACDIAEGMEYLESKRVVHRDLAARNILVASPELVKISDFGLAQCINPKDPYYKMKTNRNLPLKCRYAPESILLYRFSHKSDVWSYGVTLWQLYSFGSDPYFPLDTPEDPESSQQPANLRIVELLNAGKRLHCPEDCPNEMYKLMQSCWKHEPNDRPDFTTLKLQIKELMN